MGACVWVAASRGIEQEGVNVCCRTTRFYEIDVEKNKWCRGVHACLQPENERPCAFGGVSPNTEKMPMKCYEHAEASGKRSPPEQGCDCQPLEADSSQHGLPQRRVRPFVLGVLRPTRALAIFVRESSPA